MSSLVNDTVVTSVAMGSLGVVLIGGIYYISPKWENVSADAAEDAVVSLATAPFSIAGKLGSRLGGNIMKGLGYTYTASELAELQPKLFAQSSIANTPENHAKQIYDIMQQPGQKEQLHALVVNFLGNDAAWNEAVAKAYLPMFLVRMHDAIDEYMKQ